ncbi:hypothetical protein [Ensifer soli]|uniref:hypothetical protein n=1 Tax=Ciceribacter sp. sgz301302 TaxID=3342379 RepID=UPI0035B7C8F9
MTVPEALFFGVPLSEDFDPPSWVAARPGERPDAWVRRVGADLLEIFRSHRGAGADGRAVEWHCVGGHVDLTVIRQDGVTTERLRTWPDTIGERIVPERVAA